MESAGTAVSFVARSRCVDVSAKTFDIAFNDEIALDFGIFGKWRRTFIVKGNFAFTWNKTCLGISHALIQIAAPGTLFGSAR